VVVATIIPIANDGTNPKVQTYTPLCRHWSALGRQPASTSCCSTTKRLLQRIPAIGPS
jgi:hypothetical protein